MLRNRFFVALAALLLLAGSASAGHNKVGGDYPTGGINLTGPLPMDVAGVTWQVAGGIGALTKKWLAGPLFDVIGHDGGTYTIFAKNGYPDVRKLAGLMGITPNSGIAGLLCSKVYDQTGGGHHWTQGTTANQPAIWLINGNVYLFFGGILSTNAQNLLQAQYFAFAAGTTLNTQAASLFFVTNPYTTGDSAWQGPLTSGAPAAHKSDNTYLWAPGFGFGPPGSAGEVNLNNFSGPVVTGTQITIQQSILSLVLGPSLAQIWLNEATGTDAAQPALSGNNLYWGFADSAPVPAGYSGRQLGMMEAASAITTTQAQAVRNALYRWANIKPLPASGFVNLVIDGASFDQGQGGDASGLYRTQNGGGYGWAEMLKDYLQQRGYAVQFNNNAITGARLDQVGSQYAADTFSYFNSSAKKNVYFGFNSAIGNTLSQTNGFTASMAGTVMTVTGTVTGEPLQVGQVINGTGVTASTITSFNSGTGGAGTYNMSVSQAVISEAMTGTSTGLSAYNDFLVALALVKAQAWDVIVTYLFNDPGPSANHDYNVLMLANANTNGIKIIQLQPTNTANAANADGHPKITGYQNIFGNIIGQILPLLF